MERQLGIRVAAGIARLKRAANDELMEESEFAELAMEIIDSLYNGIHDEFTMPRHVMAEAVAKKCLLRGSFKLRSGAISEYYFDKYRLESDPYLLRHVAYQMAGLIPEGTTLLAGLEMGGIPLVSILSQYTGIPCCFVRKTAKEHGTCLSIEGVDPAGHDITIIEDVVTSGGAVFDAIADLESRKPKNIGAVVCAIARWNCKLDTNGAVESGPEALAGFDARQVNLFPLLTLSDLNPFLEEV